MSEEILKKRLSELAERSYNGRIFTFSDFLGLGEQSALESIRREIAHAGITLFGGAPGTERVMARFGDEEELGYSVDFPISIIEIAPKSQKFSEELSHRDCLGAIMSLGIERDTLGDIVILGKTAYLFAKEAIADYIIENLTKIRHTDVIARLADGLPCGELYKTERITVQVSSERLDSVIARAFGLSREESGELFRRGRVFVSGRETENLSHSPKPGDTISVRGCGRFIYLGYKSTSKKGKLNIEIDKFV